jgi:hypothetical protein
MLVWGTGHVSDVTHLEGGRQGRAVDGRQENKTLTFPRRWPSCRMHALVLLKAELRAGLCKSEVPVGGCRGAVAAGQMSFPGSIQGPSAIGLATVTNHSTNTNQLDCLHKCLLYYMCTTS